MGNAFFLYSGEIIYTLIDAWRFFRYLYRSSDCLCGVRGVLASDSEKTEHNASELRAETSLDGGIKREETKL